MRNVLLLILISTGISCSNSSSEFFIGKWQILSAVENDQYITLKNNWMHLKADGSFDSYDGDSDKRETGNWEYEPKEKLLNIIGNAGDEDNSKWILLMRNDTLIFSSSEDHLKLKAIKMK